ncbi:hypothetical protein M5689_006900 [Euphorbia peplus]|nr:hypothetical protein M5689_006900 [Euphorbia peplus]
MASVSFYKLYFWREETCHQLCNLVVQLEETIAGHLTFSTFLSLPGHPMPYYLVPGIMRGKDSIASETEVQSFSIICSNDSSVILINMLHIASNVIYKRHISFRSFVLTSSTKTFMICYMIKFVQFSLNKV